VFVRACVLACAHVCVVCVWCVCVCLRVVCVRGVLWCVCVCVCACGVCVRMVWCGVVCVFLKMKEHLAGKRHADDDLQHTIVDRLNRLAADW
jgi:hypothetical protein